MRFRVWGDNCKSYTSLLVTGHDQSYIGLDNGVEAYLRTYAYTSISVCVYFILYVYTQYLVRIYCVYYVFGQAVQSACWRCCAPSALWICGSLMADSDDDDVVVTKSPEGKVLQSYNLSKLEPKVVFEKLHAIAAQSPAWSRLFAFLLEKKRAGDPVLCWLKCKQCSDLLSPSNVSRAFGSHQKACKVLKRQKVHIPFSASGNGSVSQRLSFGAASGSGSGGETEPAPGSLQVFGKSTHYSSCVCTWLP